MVLALWQIVWFGWLYRLIVGLGIRFELAVFPAREHRPPHNENQYEQSRQGFKQK